MNPVRKRCCVDLPGEAEGAILAVVVWHDKKGRSQLTVEHRSTAVPFEVAREALVSALALLEPDSDARFTHRAASEAGRGLEYADEPELRKEPS